MPARCYWTVEEDKNGSHRAQKELDLKASIWLLRGARGDLAMSLFLSELQLPHQDHVRDELACTQGPSQF